jgi:hypothetical protein
MTAYLLSRPRPKPAAKKAVILERRAPIPNPTIALAAAAAPARKKFAKKKSAAKKETAAAKESRSIRPKDKKTSTKRKK